MPQGPLQVDGITQIAPLQARALPLTGTELVEVQTGGKRYKTTVADLLGAGGGAGSVELAPLTFATLPASPAAGTICYITDGSSVTWGATQTGSSTHHTLVWYNGSNWTVLGI